MSASLPRGTRGNPDDPMGDVYWLKAQDARVAELEAENALLRTRIAHQGQDGPDGWECADCHCLNRDDEAFCFRCGAGDPRDA